MDTFRPSDPGTSRRFHQKYGVLLTYHGLQTYMSTLFAAAAFSTDSIPEPESTHPVQIPAHHIPQNLDLMPMLLQFLLAPFFLHPAHVDKTSGVSRQFQQTPLIPWLHHQSHSSYIFHSPPMVHG